MAFYLNGVKYNIRINNNAFSFKNSIIIEPKRIRLRSIDGYTLKDNFGTYLVLSEAVTANDKPLLSLDNYTLIDNNNTYLIIEEE